MRGRRALSALVALALVASTGVLVARSGWWPAAASPVGVGVPADYRYDPAHPFRGTPAEDWAEGSAGIVPPPAGPLVGLTSDEVANAYDRVRAMLVTARLDHRSLLGHDAEPALALFATTYRAHARTAVELGVNADAVLTRIAGDQALLPVAPRVTGSMRAEVRPDGLLVVRTDYLFAHAFAYPDPDGVRSPMEVVALVRHKADYLVVVEDADHEQLWQETHSGYAYSVSCEAYAHGYLAPAHSVRGRSAESVTRNPRPLTLRYFDLDRVTEALAGCYE
ncbi:MULTISPECIES: hypothetical protein [Actinosynnema]|uniref:hypothetical protein n=1 Tax=Actinosynnema TaxID=40566 RepID=UPI0020A2E24B|nr:hypothetical protein [Actinosynnema pretiosum]